MNRKNTAIETEYRPHPFWSWNDRLEPQETARQVRLMGDAGIGGFFMHARGGLQTAYMSEEWHANIRAAIDAAKEYGMHPWIYDEDGWPSGFGGGIVSGKGVDYQQKYLRIEAGDRRCETTVCHAGGYHLYYEVNPFYVDTLDPKVVALFIDRIYRPYAERYGDEIEGFFTDEPQVSRRLMPWSFVLPEAYRKRYGEDLLPHLHELFCAEGDYRNTRFRFWKLVTDLFSESYMKQVHDFCRSHGLRLTGHLLCEETLESQLLCHGAIMPHYEYFDIPGMDWLGKTFRDCLTPLQVSSVAHQLGRRLILSESFAGCGHNAGHEELKGLYEWQMVRGVNLLCPHLLGYTLRGLRKRDYPPALNYQQPWWRYSELFNDRISGIGKLLAKGEVRFDTLLLHPQASAWELFDGGKNEGLEELNGDLLKTIRTLEQKHICFHLGDETVMERHARVEGATLVIGTQRYTRVVLPRHRRLFENTERLLREYRAGGGVIVSAEAIPENPIVDNPQITYTERILNGHPLRYFVNSTEAAQSAVFGGGGVRVLPETGETERFDGRYCFAPHESLLLWDDGTAFCQTTPERPYRTLTPQGEWQVVGSDENALTLDRCDYWFDGVLQGENEYILSVMQKALEQERPLRLRLRFTVRADYVPERLYLAFETPELYTVFCNGAPLTASDCGYYLDRSFRKTDISGMFCIGLNTIEAEMDFVQSRSVYENARKAWLFEVEKNRFTCDREAEAFYLVGNFGVSCGGDWIPSARRSVLTEGDFCLTEPPKTVALAHLEQQGFPFFAGRVTVEKTFFREADEMRLVFGKRGLNCVEAELNGVPLGARMWEPFVFDLTPHLRDGENRLRLTLTNNLRNLLGPHHLGEEPEYTRPGSFQKERSFWNPEPVWDERYCFADTGLYDN